MVTPNPFANVVPAAPTDGEPYATAVPLVSTEADLFNQSTTPPYDPAPVKWAEGILASVVFTATGGPQPGTAYVVMQTDVGDGQWLDIAWCSWSGVTGSAVFALSAGVAGANAFQQTRAVGAAPSPALGANQCVVGGRIRFVGARVPSGSSSSSSSSGSLPQVTVSVRFKRLGLR